jgi:hypothetical protein
MFEDFSKTLGQQFGLKLGSIPSTLYYIKIQNNL